MDWVAWRTLFTNVLIAFGIGYQTSDWAGAITAVAAIVAGLFQPQPHK